MATFIDPTVSGSRRARQAPSRCCFKYDRGSAFFTFGEHHVARVDLGVSASNSAAIDCYEKLGFVRVGTWPKAIMTGSHTLDVLWMTVTRDRWARSTDKKQ
jgi:hypothetical protein